MHSTATLPEPDLSKHAAVRAKQRGVPLAVIDLLLRHADAEIKQGGGCRSIWLSRAEAARLQEEGISPTLVERSRDVALVVAANGSIVTVTHLYGRRQRPYRRLLDNRSRRAYRGLPDAR